MLRSIEARCRAIGAEYRGEVSRGHSRWETGRVSEALRCRKVESTDMRRPYVSRRRPERFPARGLKERSTRLPRNGRTASDQDEVAVGATGDEASVVLHGAAGELG